jgi:hypothetical protein
VGDGAYGADAVSIGPDRGLLYFKYDSVNGTYTLIGTNNQANLQDVFGPENQSSGLEAENFIYLSKPNTVRGDRVSYPSALIILKNSPSNSMLVLNYLTYNLWIASGFQAFLTGTETIAGDAPRTGSATYRGIVDGQGTGRLLGSTGSLTADFAAGTVTTSLSLQTARDFDGNPATPLNGSLTGIGAIGAGTSHFGGDLKGTLNGAEAKGTFLGGFYGPKAAEAGYAFSASTADPNSSYAVFGVFVGKQ